MTDLQSSEAILNDLFSSIENNSNKKLPKSENETEDEDSDSDESAEKKVSENEDSRKQEKDLKKRRKKDKKSKKAKKSHKHHKKKHDKSTDFEDDRSENFARKHNNHGNDPTHTRQNNDRDFRDKQRSYSDYSNDKGGYDRHEKFARYEYESSDAHSHGRMEHETAWPQDRDRIRQQKSEELLENKRKNRPMSPPKDIYHRDRRRCSNNDTQNWRPSKYIPVESSRSYSDRIAPPPPEDWHRGANGNREHDRERSPGYHDHRSRTYKRDRGSSYRYEESDKYNQEERPPKRQDKIEHSRISHAGSEENKKVSPKKESDSFWDTKWEAMELQKKADAQDRKGKHYLEDELKRKRAKEDSTPSLSPERSPSPECDELKRINKMKEIQGLVVQESEKYVSEPQDPTLFKYDDNTKMWRRKTKDELNDKQELKAITYEENNSDVNKIDLKEEGELKETSEVRNVANIISSESLSAENIDEIRKKREKFKKEVKHERHKDRTEEKDDKEDGEVNSDDDRERGKGGRYGKRSIEYPYSRSRSKSRDKIRGGFGYCEESGSTYKSSRDTGFYSSNTRFRDWRPVYERRRYSRSPSRDNNYKTYRGRRSRSKSFDRYRTTSRRYNKSRSRSRSRSKKSKDDFYTGGSRAAIDKAKLLAIARKNAVKLLSSDNLMGMDHDRLVAIKSGGQSLGTLTSFCRELAKKGITDDFSDDDDIINKPYNSDDEQNGSSNIHHPFAVNPSKPLPNPLLMGLSREGITAETLTPQARIAARSHRMIEFPVSSGNAHRVKVEEQPVNEEQADKDVAQAISMSGFQTSTDRLALTLTTEASVGLLETKKWADHFQEKISKDDINTEEGIAAATAALDGPDNETIVESTPGQSMEEIEAKMNEEKAKQEAADAEAIQQMTESTKLNLSNPLGTLLFNGGADSDKLKEEMERAKYDAEMKAVAEEEAAKSQTAVQQPEKIGIEKRIREGKDDKVFKDVVQPSKDLAAIVAQRLIAMEKLKTKPNDPESLSELYEAQKQISVWAESKNKPGQFTGSTGAKILSKGELTLGVQAWAKQSQFTDAPKVSGGFGEYILRKMGWKEGEGLGKDGSGEVDPLTLDIKQDMKGLMAQEEAMKKRGKGSLLTLTGCKDLSGKHPVSALLELCTRRRWGPPSFSQAFECGPSHKKQYIFKVVVNGEAYQPSIASDNKKKAKSDAATAALQQMGLLEKDPNNPL